MRRRSTPTTSSRTTRLTCTADDAWAVAADGRPGPRWYVDAAPVVFRGALDRLLPGARPQCPAPGRALLEAGDEVGFWRVSDADPVARRLELTALVRAPGVVTMTTEVEPDGPGACRVSLHVRLRPRGVLGVGYLVVDLPAREAFTELTHRRLLDDVRRATASAPG